MSEDNTSNKQPGSTKKEAVGFILAIVVMLIGIVTVWQVFLSGKEEGENTSGADTIVQVKVDTVKIKDSIKTQNKTENTSTENKSGEIKSASDKETDNDTGKVKNDSKVGDKLTAREKEMIKEGLNDIPKSKSKKS